MDTLDRYKGALLGLACGDALGTTLEFKSPGTFDPIADMIGGGPFRLQAGQWTDDTSMALCLAESLITQKGCNPIDQLQRYCWWYRRGYMSSTGECFDIGNATVTALENFEHTGHAYGASDARSTAGNGSLMRLAPISMAYGNSPEKAILKAALSSRTTHGAPQAVDSCRFFASLIVGAFQGKTKEELLTPHFSVVEEHWKLNPLDYTLNSVLATHYKDKMPPEINGMGYVITSLEAALWAFYHTDNFEDGALKVVNLGDDADTTGAIFGQIAGAYYGLSGIPTKWIDKLHNSAEIETMASQLYEMGGHNI